MKNYLVAERYAKALCDALEDAALDNAGEMLAALNDIYQEAEALRNVLSSPAIEIEQRTALLRQVLDTAGVEGAVARLAETMLARGRITLLADVAAVFGLLADERLGRVRATVTTASETSPEQEERMQAALSAWSGKDVRVKREVDPEILGGVIARLGGAVIDGSVSTRIRRLREALLALDIRTADASQT